MNINLKKHSCPDCGKEYYTFDCPECKAPRAIDKIEEKYDGLVQIVACSICYNRYESIDENTWEKRGR